MRLHGRSHPRSSGELRYFPVSRRHPGTGLEKSDHTHGGDFRVRLCDLLPRRFAATLKPSLLLHLTGLLSLGATMIHAPAFGGETGAIRGRVPLGGAVVPIALDKYTGKISGRVATPARPVAGVWLEGPGLHAPTVMKTATVEQKGYQFASGLLVVAVGAQVAFPNLDPDYHNVFSLSKAKRFDLGRYKPDERPAPVLTFDKPGVVRLLCEIHEHMRGTIIVVDSPHFTRTAEDGSFTLPGIAPGTYTLKAWADERRTWEQTVTIRRSQTLEVNLPAR